MFIKEEIEMNYIETINSQIISAVVKWSAITHEDLYYYLGLKTQKSTLHVRTHTLIKNKVIKSTKLMNQTKPILHSYEGTKLVAGDDIKISINGHLPHDSGLSNVCIRLLQLPNVYDVNTLKDDNFYNKQLVVPDAEVFVIENDRSLTIAVEMEASRKGKQRIVNKLIAYSQNSDYEFVLYFFNNEKDAVYYANILHILENDKSTTQTNLKPEKFYFFVRNPRAKMDDFLNSFKPIYPSDISALLSLLNVIETIEQ